MPFPFGQNLLPSFLTSAVRNKNNTEHPSTTNTERPATIRYGSPQEDTHRNTESEVHDGSNTTSASIAEPPVLYSRVFYEEIFVAGAVASGTARVCVSPLDLIKVRMQVSPGLYRGLADAVVTIGKTEGAAGLYRGASATACGYALQGAHRFGLYEFFKKSYAQMIGEDAHGKHRIVTHLAASASAEMVADLFLCPFEAAKVRMQTRPDFGTNMVQVLGKMHAQEGFSGLYKGLVPLWMRQVPVTVVEFFCYERAVEAIYGVLPRDRDDYSRSAQLGISFVSGYISGLFSATASHPADTILSRLNRSPCPDNANIFVRIVRIVPEIGFLNLYAGLRVRVLMLGTLTGIQWLIYDSVKGLLGLPTSGNRKVF
eukprot:TRINITY_DN557_c0_g2_i2.p1 TRINITY_DN557_c0_g2~~TRINITY_DN557_c0_g2_i2.p1  ORF type:complete len:371 (+),score=30.48 TRINITY_DN557_c0_g2_i2:202-1314(+)